MFSRCVAILIGTWLPMLAVVVPFGSTHLANALIAGTLGTLLSLASLSDNRFRVAAAVVGGWVALSPFVFSSTLVEKWLTVSWGVTMFVCMIGPFSDKPLSIPVGVAAAPAPALAVAVPVAVDAPRLSKAA